MVIRSVAGTPAAQSDRACVETAAVSIVLRAPRNHAMGTDLSKQLDVNPDAMKIIVVKSSQHSTRH